VPSPPRSAVPPRPTSPLMVDELDYHNVGNSSPTTPPFAATRNVVGVDKIKAQLIGQQQPNGAKTLGPIDLASRAPCPCCARYVVKECDGKPQQPQQERQPSSITASASTDDDSKDASLPGSLDPTQTSYAVQSIAVQGWVHKKGTGNDIFGSRAWKSRWATLGTATVPGYDVAVPLLTISWFPHSETPSTVLLLDPVRTVVMPVDRYPTEEKVVQWNTFTFEIVHNGGNGGGVGDDDGTTTRVFSVPEQERSEWVCALQQSLREYEQRLQKKTRRDAAAGDGRRVSPDLLRPPLSPRNSIKLS